MERILKMKKRFKPSSVALSFFNSKLYIGIPTRTEFFSYRGGQVTMDDLEWLYKEVKTIVSIIDDLNLTLRIWTKE